MNKKTEFEGNRIKIIQRDKQNSISRYQKLKFHFFCEGRMAQIWLPKNQVQEALLDMLLQERRGKGNIAVTNRI